MASVREKLCIPDIFAFRPRDDPNLNLYGAVYKPNPALHGPGPYPTVVSVYGGPHVQKVGGWVEEGSGWVDEVFWMMGREWVGGLTYSISSI